MKILRSLFCGAAALSLATMALAAPAATNAAPGQVQSPASQKPEPSTPAPKQANAKSAPGAAAPNGTNGTTAAGRPVTKAPNTVEKKGKKGAKEENATATANPAAPATTPAPAGPAKSSAKPAVTVLDHFMQDLNDALKLTPEQKKDIQGYYLADAAPLHDILNDPSASPLQQAQQASDLRDQRNAKVEAVLADVQQKHDFYAVEANYRVPLLEAAASGTLSAAPAQGTSGGASAPTQTPAAPNARGPAQ